MLGVIAGTNLRGSRLLSGLNECLVESPYGRAVCHVGDDVVLLLRHGPSHRVPPHRINHRANIAALVNLDVDEVVSVNSCGSLKEAVKRGWFMVPHDFVCLWDSITFFEDEVYHTTPEMDENLRRRLVEAVRACGEAVYEQGVYVQVRGPRLETKAEVHILSTFGDVVGMTLASEATLCCELGIPFASLCSVDNYANGVVGKTTMQDVFDAAAASRERVERVLDVLMANERQEGCAQGAQG